MQDPVGWTGLHRCAGRRSFARLLAFNPALIHCGCTVQGRATRRGQALQTASLATLALIRMEPTSSPGSAAAEQDDPDKVGRRTKRRVAVLAALPAAAATAVGRSGGRQRRAVGGGRPGQPPLLGPVISPPMLPAQLKPPSALLGAGLWGCCVARPPTCAPHHACLPCPTPAAGQPGKCAHRFLLHSRHPRVSVIACCEVPFSTAQ